jgi:mono/diheme cytochrome c family protein
MDDFEQLTNTTMERMGGSSLHPAYVDALARYVDGIAHLPRPDDQPPALIARGADVFASVGAGCASCHSGTRMSNDQSVDVGTGRRFQVPSLRGLRYRAPYLHDGRAPTLRSVLTDAHTEGHGGVGHLTPEDLDALVSYLESL